MITLSILTVLAVCSCGLAKSTEKHFVLAGDFNINIKDGKSYFSLKNNENGAVLTGKLAVSEDAAYPKLCDNDPNCLQYGSSLRLAMEKVGQCYHINWTSSINSTVENCFDYGDQKWYGGPENIKQYWPFNNMTFKDYSYITKMDQNQAVAEPYWLTSWGSYIYVDRTAPLFIDANNHYDNSLCLIAKQVPPYLPRGSTSLSYKICNYKNTRKAHMKAIQNDLGKPSGVPDKRMVQHPIWSTWARFEWNVNDTAVKRFAQDIVANGFNNSQLEIDDNWGECYGTINFNKTRFHDMPKLATELKNMGFRITLWNHPFVNTNCKLFKELSDKGYLVKDQSGNSVSVWWDGQAGVVDFTNPEAADWYVTQHRKLLKQNNIDSFKLDAGESSWLPQIPQLNAPFNDQPNAFTTAYVRTGTRFGSMVEVRVGHHTQDVPIYVRMLDKDSKWTFENGLPTLLTTLFQLNLNGYPFVLPDMVGGNAYPPDVATKEMFIRWLQAATFLPVIQFSLAPWDFDKETVEISKTFTALHYAYSDKIYEQMEESVRKGVPVNTPIWWVSPLDEEAHNVWSEYMLGDDILVAPVLEKGAVSRDIYLPKGSWRDEADPQHKVFQGPQWIRDYHAPLHILPFFTRVGKMNIDDDDDDADD